MKTLISGFIPLVVLCLMAVQPSLAQTYARIDSLIEAGKHKDAEPELRSLLQKNPNDDSAHYYLGIIPLSTRDVERYDEAIEHFTTCVKLKPNSSEYHMWLGRAYGLKAKEAGIFSAMGYVGDIKESFLKAVELDPSNFSARHDLIQFYLQAPGIVGGSDEKAAEVAADYAKVNPSMAGLLFMAMYLYDGEFAKAEEQIAQVRKPEQKDQLRFYRNSWSNIGFTYLRDEQPASAQRVFTRYTKEFPEDARGYHGLGRSLYDQNKVDEAIPLLEKALALDKNIGSQYRLGLAYERKGDKQKAIKYLEEFVAMGPRGNTKAFEDAKEKLEDLK